MPLTDPICIDYSKITSFDTVLAELYSLGAQCGQGYLGQFSVFNGAYIVVMRSIQEAVDNNYFQNPKFIEKLSVCFALYYFQAVVDTSSASPNLATAWAKMGKTTRCPTMPSFVLLLMGANAHINHDLPLALLQAMGKDKSGNSMRDLLKIDKLLMGSGREIISTFDEPNKLVSFVKRRCQFLYYRPIMYLILYWRILAWRNYTSIKKHEHKRHVYKQHSIKIADRFIKLGNFLG